MATHTDPNEVIQLPRMRPGDLGTLMLELSTTARGVIAEASTAKAAAKRHNGAAPLDVPDRVVEALDDLDAARPPLIDAIRRETPSDTLTPEQRALDLKMNAGWRAVRLTFELGAQRATMAGDEAKAVRCRDAIARVLPDGLSFIAFVGRPEYTPSDMHLGVLEGECAALCRSLPGGAETMRELRAIHDAYGRAFFITAPAPAQTETGPGVGESATEAAAATREYVAAVLGTVRRADPRTRALADRLLSPLANYGRPANPSAPSDDAEKRDPVPSPTPVTPNK